MKTFNIYEVAVTVQLRGNTYNTELGNNDQLVIGKLLASWRNWLSPDRL